MSRLRLHIGPVIEQAEKLHRRVLAELPGHAGLGGLAAETARAARNAELVSRRMKRPFSLHRLPVAFLTVALLTLLLWTYGTFFRTTTLTIALPDRDAAAIRERVLAGRRLNFRSVSVPGSTEGAQQVDRGEVDLAFVQGGVPFPADLPRVQTDAKELVLWFVRARLAGEQPVRRVLTSVAGEGSHAVARQFLQAWQPDGDVQFVHDWGRVTDDDAYRIPEEIDAVFVVKDLADDRTLRAVNCLEADGFRLTSAPLGAKAGQFEYLQPTTVPAGHLRAVPPVPAEPVATYAVATFLVARRGLTPRLLATAGHLLDPSSPTITDRGVEPTVHDASDILQGIDAFLGILINIGLAFLALLGVEILAYRRRFHELNTMVSLISVHQSSKDVLGLTHAKVRQENLLYLGLCSDLLGLVSMIAGYYTQENSSLLFNNLSEIIHQRCDGLKINIQLKILHALVGDPPPESGVPGSPPHEPDHSPP